MFEIVFECDLYFGDDDFVTSIRKKMMWPIKPSKGEQVILPFDILCEVDYVSHDLEDGEIVVYLEHTPAGTIDERYSEEARVELQKLGWGE